MRILIISQWCYPEPDIKSLVLARKLRDRGHTVCVLTGFPNYPEGKIYPGYRMRIFQYEVIDGVLVMRVPLYPSHDRNPIRRALNYISFALSAGILGTLFVPNCDVAYVYHPPASVGWAAWFIKSLRRIPFVYDIQDLWPDTVSQSDMMRSSFLNRLLGYYCLWVYRTAAHIVVQSPGFKKTLEYRGVAGDKISVIYNWCDESAIRPIAADMRLSKELNMAEKFNIVFAGNMGKAQGLDIVIKAAGLLQDLRDIQFVLIGDGTEVCRLKEEVNACSITNVIFLARRPMATISSVLNLADVLLVHLVNDTLFRITIPSKTQAYMRMGQPILMGVAGDAAEIIKRFNAGICFNPSDHKSLADAVRQLYAMSPDEREIMGRNGSIGYEREMSLDVGVTKMEAILCMASRSYEKRKCRD